MPNKQKPRLRLRIAIIFAAIAVLCALVALYQPGNTPLSPQVLQAGKAKKEKPLATKPVKKRLRNSTRLPIQQAHSSQSAQSAQPSQEAPEPIPEPLAELRPTEEEDRLLYEAEEAALSSCMRERGFTYVPGTYEGDDMEGPGGRPALGDLESAKWNGYGVADSIENGRIPPPLNIKNEEILAGLSSEEQRRWDEALSGPPISSPPAVDAPEADPAIEVVSIPFGPTVYWRRDSCFARARQKVYGDDKRLAELDLRRDLITDEITMRTMDDSVYVEGVQQWKKCMSQQGFTYEFPGQAAEQLAQAHEAGTLTIQELRQQEIQVATADASCYQQVGLAKTHIAVQSRIEKEVRSEQEEILQAINSMKKESLDLAERLISDR